MDKNKEISTCYLRFFNAFQTEHSLTIYVDDQIFVKDMFYEDFSHYKLVSSKDYSIKITPYKRTTALAQTQVILDADKVYTLILAPHPKATDKLQLYCIEDFNRPVHPPDCVIRLAHFTHGIGAVDFLLEENVLRFKNIGQSEVSRYVPLDGISHQLKWIDHSYKTEHLTLQHVFKPLRLYTLYLIGNNTKDYPIKCVVSIDGCSYLPLKEIKKKEKRA